MSLLKNHANEISCGETPIEMSRELHMKYRRLVFAPEKKEFGGGLVLQFEQQRQQQQQQQAKGSKKRQKRQKTADLVGHVTRDTGLRSGKYASISLPDDNALDFHTHPSACLDADTCTVPVPSPEDVRNAVAKFRLGSLAHLIYVSSGTYLIHPCLKTGTFFRCPKTANATTRLLDDVVKVFEDLYQRYDREEPVGKMTTVQYRELFLKKLKDFGLTGMFFHGDDVPTFTVPVKCRYANIPISHDIITIDDMQQQQL